MHEHMNWRDATRPRNGEVFSSVCAPTHRRASSNVFLIVTVCKSIIMYLCPGIHQYIIKGKRTTRFISLSCNGRLHKIQQHPSVIIVHDGQEQGASENRHKTQISRYPIRARVNFCIGQAIHLFLALLSHFSDATVHPSTRKFDQVWIDPNCP